MTPTAPPITWSAANTSTSATSRTSPTPPPGRASAASPASTGARQRSWLAVPRTAPPRPSARGRGRAPHRTAYPLVGGDPLDVGDFADVTAPATGKSVGCVARVDGGEATQLARRAADRAAEAQRDWASASPRSRAKILHDAVDLLK